jgi:hypothetical protein
MPFHDIPVEPRSQEQIEAAAAAWIRESGQEGQEVIDILKIFDAARVDIVPQRDSEMGDDLARAAPSSNRVFVRRSLLEAIGHRDRLAKMDFAHEFGHVVFHRLPEMKARKVDGNEQFRFIPEDVSAEHQAWRGARALTMPLPIVRQCATAFELAHRCEVPIEHAQLRITEVGKLGKREIPQSVRSIIEKKKSPRELADERRSAEAKEFLAAWSKAERIPGDPSARMCSRGKWRVTLSEHNMMTQCGWKLVNGKIVAWMDLASE